MGVLLIDVPLMGVPLMELVSHERVSHRRVWAWLSRGYASQRRASHRHRIGIG